MSGNSSTGGGRYSFTASVSAPGVTRLTAVIRTVIYNHDNIPVRKVGCMIYDREGDLICRHCELRQHSGPRFTVCFDLAKDLGLALRSDSSYSYEFFIAYEDTDYVTDRFSFST